MFFRVGGWVQSMAWDSNGERLAVIFTSEPLCLSVCVSMCVYVCQCIYQ